MSQLNPNLNNIFFPPGISFLTSQLNSLISIFSIIVSKFIMLTPNITLINYYSHYPTIKSFPIWKTEHNSPIVPNHISKQQLYMSSHYTFNKSQVIYHFLNNSTPIMKLKQLFSVLYAYSKTIWLVDHTNPKIIIPTSPSNCKTLTQNSENFAPTSNYTSNHTYCLFYILKMNFYHIFKYQQIHLPQYLNKIWQPKKEKNTYFFFVFQSID